MNYFLRFIFKSLQLCDTFKTVPCILLTFLVLSVPGRHFLIFLGKQAKENFSFVTFKG